jgi:hypothetical protein
MVPRRSHPVHSTLPRELGGRLAGSRMLGDSSLCHFTAVVHSILYQVL